MKAVDYLKAKERMTNGCDADYCVFKCPLSSRRNKIYKSCTKFELSNPEQAIEIVENWTKENPVKTYLSVLLEKFPNAEMHKNGLPKFCPDLLFGEKAKSKECINDMNCKDCWNREYKEE